MPARRPGYAPVGEEARPILKWPGGKRQLLPALRRFYPPRFDRYVEPFLGSGAVFLDCHNRGLLQGRAVCLSDINADVIGCYGMVRDHVEAVIDSLEALEQRHRESAADHFYYEVRDGRFNRIRTGLPEGSELAASYTPELTAMLIYLNRSGYNGLFRVNSRGEFNVPAGRYEKITICDSANLRRVSGALNRPGLQLIVCRFEDALAPCGTGDFVYLDPPYAPLSRTAQFTSCPAGGFGPRRSSGFRKRSSGSPRGAPACC